MSGLKQAQIFDDDLMIASYPRSGSTWLRYMLACIKYPDLKWEDDLIGRVMPDIYNPGQIHKWVKRPRIVKTHEEYHHLRLNKVVYMYRDPRDVMCSLRSWRYNNQNYNTFMKEFLSGNIIPGAWNWHVIGWLDGREKHPTYYLKYEDLVKEPHKYFGEVLKFFGMYKEDVDMESIIGIVINRYPPGKPWGGLKTFIRPLKAKQNNWKYHFTEEMNDTFYNFYKDIMIRLGYTKDGK